MALVWRSGLHVWEMCPLILRVDCPWFLYGSAVFYVLGITSTLTAWVCGVFKGVGLAFRLICNGKHVLSFRELTAHVLVYGSAFFFFLENPKNPRKNQKKTKKDFLCYVCV